MALERPLIRTPRHVPPRGYVGVCAGQATYPRKLWTPLAKARSEGFRVTRPAEGTFRSVADPSSAGVSVPIDVQRAGVHFSCVFRYSERASIVNGGEMDEVLPRFAARLSDLGVTAGVGAAVPAGPGV